MEKYNMVDCKTHIFKMSVFPKMIYRYDTIPVGF